MSTKKSTKTTASKSPKKKPLSKIDKLKCKLNTWKKDIVAEKKNLDNIYALKGIYDNYYSNHFKVDVKDSLELNKQIIIKASNAFRTTLLPNDVLCSFANYILEKIAFLNVMYHVSAEEFNEFAKIEEHCIKFRDEYSDEAQLLDINDEFVMDFLDMIPELQECKSKEEVAKVIRAYMDPSWEDDEIEDDEEDDEDDNEDDKVDFSKIPDPLIIQTAYQELMEESRSDPEKMATYQALLSQHDYQSLLEASSMVIDTDDLQQMTDICNILEIQFLHLRILCYRNCEIELLFCPLYLEDKIDLRLYKTKELIADLESEREEWKQYIAEQKKELKQLDTVKGINSLIKKFDKEMTDIMSEDLPF